MGQDNDLKKALHKAILKAFRTGKMAGENAARNHSVAHVTRDIVDPNMLAEVPQKDLPAASESVLHKEVTLSELHQQKQANAMAKLGQPMKAPGKTPGAAMSAPGKATGAVSAPSGASSKPMSAPSGATSKPMGAPGVGGTAKQLRPLQSFMQKRESKRLEKAKIIAGPHHPRKPMGTVLADLPGDTYRPEKEFADKKEEKHLIAEQKPKGEAKAPPKKKSKQMEKAKIIAGPHHPREKMGTVLADLPAETGQGEVYEPSQQEMQATGTDPVSAPQAPRQEESVPTPRRRRVGARSEWENIVFHQGDEADEGLDIYYNHGPVAAIKHLMQWHYPGEHEVLDKHPDHKAGTTDSIHHHKVKGINYVLTANPKYGYIGLAAEKKNKPF